ncbi:MAG TPA: LapA family protein [Pseudolabrys sp.]|nr:LapA family protein [Pseudolabrys sp.]
MFRKIVTAIIVIPLAVVIIAFAVANRQPVTVSFDPFSSTAPAYAATVPLFVLIFVLAIAGVIVGGVAAWFGQGKWRRYARRLEGDVRDLHAEIDALRRREEAAGTVPGSSPPGPRPLVPPGGS